MFNFKDKTVLITGGSYGIGLETAKILLEKGAKVHTISRTKPSLEHKNLQIHIADLNSTFPKIDEFFDVAILNIGVNPGGKSFDEIGIEEMNRTIYLNLNVHLLALKSIKCKKIVFVDSVLSLVGLQNNSLYCACKSFISIFNESLRREGKDTYIIYPYKVNTELFAEIQDFCTLDKVYVAETIVKDIENERRERYLPWIFSLIPLLKAIFPTSLTDILIRCILSFLTKIKKD